MIAAESANAQRLSDRLAELAGISADGPGVTRLGFGALERDAHELVATWAAAEGARVEVDPAGNTVMVYREGAPYLLLGSHLDSVPFGGRFDGVAGVVAALEAARAIRDNVELGVRVVAFTCEEGAAFGRPCLGAELATGQIGDGSLDELRDSDGRSVSECAQAVGLTPHECPGWLSAPAVAAFLELHIEQGAVLEAEKVPVGIVDTIAGTARIAVTCRGRAGHAGTTPMRLRADALAGVAELILAVEKTARAERGGVATVGRLAIEPNVVTTIASQVRAIVDVRDYTDTLRQEAMVRKFEEASRRVAEERGLDVDVRLLSWREPIVLSAWPRRALSAACSELAIPFRVMPSGAGHDAAIVATKAPAAMIFVPTPGGLSHVPEEACRIDDLAQGADILAAAALRLDAEARDVTVEAH